MDNFNFQLDETQPKLDLGKQAANSAYEEIWQSSLRTTQTSAQFLGDASASVVAGAAGGALVGLGIGKVNDVATRAVAQISHIPLSIAMTALTGRPLPLYEPIVLPSSIPRIVPKAGLIGAAVGLAGYAAYNFYENYTSKDK